MIQNIAVIFVIVTAFPIFDCKDTRVIPNKTNPLTPIDKIIIPQNETSNALQNNSTTVAQKTEATVKLDNLENNRKQKRGHVSEDVPMVPTPILVGDTSVQQSYYQSPLMMYPFSMMNTYYPRYFPYTYPGYHGHPYYGSRGLWPYYNNVY